MMKINLGCGQNLLKGYINVDKFGEPDVKFDLETFPWPWESDSVDLIRLNHTLEHLGGDPDVFVKIMQELYRVIKPKGVIHIAVPHPRHDNFLNDPTHVRVVTPTLLGLFSMENCRQWKAEQAANSPLAIYHKVDFEVRSIQYTLEEAWLRKLVDQKITKDELDEAVKTHNNVVSEIAMELYPVKPFKECK